MVSKLAGRFSTISHRGILPTAKVLGDRRCLWRWKYELRFHGANPLYQSVEEAAALPQCPRRFGKDEMSLRLSEFHVFKR